MIESYLLTPLLLIAITLHIHLNVREPYQVSIPVKLIKLQDRRSSVFFLVVYRDKNIGQVLRK